MEIKQALSEYGLNEKEIKVYLASLSLGKATAAEIAKKSGIIRETSYFILDSLIEKRLVSNAIESNIKRFIANSPQTLIDELKRKEATVSEILSDLNVLYNTDSEKTSVETYEGKLGISKQFYAISNLAQNEIKGIINTDFAFKLLPFQPNKATTLRVERNITSDMIIDKTNATQSIIDNNDKELRKTTICSWVSDFKIGLYIYDDKVSIMTFNSNHPYGITITDKNIANSFEIMFENLKK